MGNYTILVLRIVIALSLLGSLGVQTVILPLVWIDMEGELIWGRIALITIAALFIVGLQVIGVCIWRLLDLVRRGSVFSPAAFRWVDVMIGAIAFDALVTLSLAVLLAPSDVAPGVVGLVCGASLVMGGAALVVVVMRRLLQQAIELRTELSEVI